MAFPVLTAGINNAVIFGSYSNALDYLTESRHAARDRGKAASAAQVFAAGCFSGMMQVHEHPGWRSLAGFSSYRATNAPGVDPPLPLSGCQLSIHRDITQSCQRASPKSSLPNQERPLIPRFRQSEWAHLHLLPFVVFHLDGNDFLVPRVTGRRVIVPRVTGRRVIGVGEIFVALCDKCGKNKRCLFVSQTTILVDELVELVQAGQQTLQC